MKNIAVGIVSGLVFGFGWWAFFDGVFAAPDAFPWSHIVPAALATVSSIMLNLVTLELVKGNRTARVWVFIWLTVSCVCVGLGIWITVVEYPPQIEDNWPGVSIIVQTTLLLIFTVFLFIGKSTIDDNKSFSY